MICYFENEKFLSYKLITIHATEINEMGRCEKILIKNAAANTIVS